MKDFVKYCLRFSALFIPIYVIGILIISLLPKGLHPNIKYHPGSGGFLNTRLLELKNKTNYNILVLGSSHAYRGFDPRIFKTANLRAFILGSSAQTPVQTNYLLRKYLNNIDPQLVLYEVYPETFTFDGIESQLDLISNDQISWEITRTLWNPFNLKTLNSTILSIYNDLNGKKKLFKEQTSDSIRKYISGGFVEFNNKLLKDTLIKQKKLEILKYQLEHFNSNIKILKDRGIEVILVYSPISKYQKKSYRNEEDFYKEMNKTNLTFWDFSINKKIESDSLFYDLDHLNQSGVVIFNQMLVNKIKLKIDKKNNSKDNNNANKKQ